MRKRVPSYRFHKASGQAIVQLNGRMIYLGPWKSEESHAAYDLAIAEWLARNRQPAPPVKPETGKLTVVELIGQFWLHAEKHYRKPDGTPTGELVPLRHALRILKELYGDTPAEDFGPIKLAAVRESMILRKWARTTVNNQVKRIVRAFRWGVSRELIPASVPNALRELQGLERGRTEAKESGPVLPVADADFQATLPHLPEIVADLLRLQRLTGMRPNEVCQIRPIDVNRDGETWLYTPQSHKTAHKGRARVIAIGPRGQEILRPYLLRGADEFCFQPAESERKRRALLTANRVTPIGYGNGPGDNVKENPKRKAGASYDAGSLRHAIWRACDRAFPAPKEIKRDAAKLRAWRQSHRWSANQLRHSMATDVRAKFGLECAQVALGHSQANTTQLYAERDLAKAIEVARAIG